VNLTDNLIKLNLIRFWLKNHSAESFSSAWREHLWGWFVRSTRGWPKRLAPHLRSFLEAVANSCGERGWDWFRLLGMWRIPTRLGVCFESVRWFWRRPEIHGRVQGIHVQALLRGMSMIWKREIYFIGSEVTKDAKNHDACGLRPEALRIRLSFTCTIYRPGFALTVWI